MKKPSFTPGPWTVERAIGRVDGEYDWAIGAEIDGKLCCIAEAFGRAATTIYPNAEANAALMAAAPELLASLTEMTRLFQIAILSTTPGIAKDGMEFVKAARALIAKAEGPA